MSKRAEIRAITKYEVIDPEDGSVLEEVWTSEGALRTALDTGLDHDYRENVAYDSVPSYHDIIAWISENWGDIHEVVTGKRPPVKEG